MRTSNIYCNLRIDTFVKSKLWAADDRLLRTTIRATFSFTLRIAISQITITLLLSARFRMRLFQPTLLGRAFRDRRMLIRPTLPVMLLCRHRNIVCFHRHFINNEYCRRSTWHLSQHTGKPLFEDAEPALPQRRPATHHA
jgi:hypothetical protein